MMQVEVVQQAGAIIGESPTWAAAESALYWINVKGPALYRLDPATMQQRVWRMPAGIGAFALIGNPAGAAVALRYGLFRLEFASGSLSQLAPPPYDPQRFRFNEGGVDDAGPLWVGVMFDPLKGDEPHEASQRESLHRFTLQEGLRVKPDAAELHNSMAWSRDGRHFHLSYSRQREVFLHQFDVRRGRLGTRKVFARVPEASGVPDGAAVDAEDGYWCALHGGSPQRRYTVSGAEDRDSMLPVSQPTMCAFGGRQSSASLVRICCANAGGAGHRECDQVH